MKSNIYYIYRLLIQLQWMVTKYHIISIASQNYENGLFTIYTEIKR